MARIIAIDYGTKRCGIAVTDVNKIIATPLKTIHSLELVDFIVDYCGKESVEKIVIGKPVRFNNTDSEVEKHIVGFIRKIKKLIPSVDIVRYDERFTSKLASNAIAISGKSKKERQKKELVDLVSATILLQSYMDYERNAIK